MLDIKGKEFHPTQMYELINMMISRRYNFFVEENWDTPQVFFLDTETGKIVGDAICHRGSYGHENGLLEIMGFEIDDVRGHLTAAEVIEIYENFMIKKLTNNE